MAGHTRTERRLRRDIDANRALSKGITQRLGKLRSWEESLLESNNHHKKNKYASAIARVGADVKTMKARLARDNAQVASRIVEEMEYSKQEVADFQKAFEKEHAEAITRQKEYEDKQSERRKQTNQLPDSEHAKLLSQPVSVLELSSRSQRCMDRLGIESLADLVKRTELELISQKNFGVTSLNETKRKLKERSLSLASG